MYKPHTIEQYKVYRFLEENFALEHFLLAPLSRFGLMLEDKTDEKIAFAFLNVNWIVLGDILIWTLANIRLTKSIGQLQSEQKTNK